MENETERPYLVRCGAYCEADPDLDGGNHRECESEDDALDLAGRGHLRS